MGKTKARALTGYDRILMMKRLWVFLVLFSGCVFGVISAYANGVTAPDGAVTPSASSKVNASSSFFLDLSGADVYVRTGFDAGYTVINPAYLLEIEAAPFLKVQLTRRISNREISALEGKKRVFLSPRPPSVVEHTLVIPFDIEESKFRALSASVSGPDLYMAGIGRNWEVYLNGRIIGGRLYSAAGGGGYTPGAGYRHVSLPAKKEFFNEGENILALRCIGEEFDAWSGLPYSGPFYFAENTRLFPAKDFIPLASVSICIMLASLYLALFLMDKAGMSNLYYVLFSFLCGIYFFSRTTFIYALFPDTNITQRLEILTLFLLTPVYARFIESLTLDRPRRFSAVLLAVSLLLGVVQIPLSLSFNADILLVWQAASLILTPYILWTDILVPFRRKMPELRRSSQKNAAIFVLRALLKLPEGNLLAASLFLFFCNAADIVMSHISNTETNLFRAGHLLFVIISAITLVHKNTLTSFQLRTASLIQSNYFDLILRHSPDILLLFDADQKIINCTDSFTGNFPKYAKTDILNRDFRDIFKIFFDEASLENISVMFYQATAQKKTISFFESIDFSLSGDTRQYEIHFTPMIDERGNPKGSMLLLSDMTDALAAIEKAERANRAKSSFLATMSHEIRTPLNAILGLTEVQLLNKLPDKTRIDLEKIQRSGNILLEIINGILDVSKIESEKFTLEPCNYSIVDVINDCVQFNLPRIMEKPIRFSLEIDANIPAKLFGDEIRIKQILNNLLSNAFKYTKRGNVDLIVSYEMLGNADGQNQILLKTSIRDTGIGIKAENIDRMFGDYTRFDYSENKLIEGTGLGLSITKKLIDMMDGEITLTSEYGKGSQFNVRIPQTVVTSEPIGEDAAQQLKSLRFIEKNGKKKIIRKNFSGRKVLVADDVSMNIDVTRGLMALYGIEVHGVLSGKTAVELVRQAEPKYDLIIMDHMMPEMSGVDAVRIIRKQIDSDYARNIPVIVFTANAISENEEIFMRNGFSGYLTKPIDVYELDTMLNKFLVPINSELPPVEDRGANDTAGGAYGLDSAEEVQELEYFEEAAADEGGGGGLETAPLTAPPPLAETSNVEISDDTNAEIDEKYEALLRAIARKLPEIDVDDALLSYGSAALFVKTLQIFAEKMPAMLSEIEATTPLDIKDYEIKAHGLKGAIRGICDETDAAAAKSLEFSAKANNIEAIHEQNPAFIKRMKFFCDVLGAALNEGMTSPPVSGKPRAKKPDALILADMREAAAQFRVQEMERLLAEIDTFTYEDDGGLVDWLKEKIENLEYTDIIERLGES